MKALNLDIFRQNLSEIRQAKRLSAKELAIKANLKQQKRINDIEEGRGSPSLDEVYSICKVLQISIDDMLNKSIKIKFEFEERNNKGFFENLGKSKLPKTYA